MTPITRRINLAEKEYVYHLCRDTTHQEMYNADLFNTRDDAWITVKVMDENRIVKQFPIPPLGHHYCRFCNGEFVIAPPSVSCTNHTADIHYGYLTFRVYSYKTEYLPDSDTEPLASNGLWQLEKDGTMTYDGLAFSSATGYPAVFAQDGIYIDSMGTMVYRKPERFPPQPNLRYISGTQDRKSVV